MNINKTDTIEFYVTHFDANKQLVHKIFKSYGDAMYYALKQKDQTRYINLRVMSPDRESGFSSTLVKFNRFNDLEVIHGHYLKQLNKLKVS